MLKFYKDFIKTEVEITSDLLWRKGGYLVAVIAILVITFAFVLLRPLINPTTVALAFLLIVLFVAAVWGSRPAFVASVLGMLCFNYYFLPPTGTLTIADPENWVALGAFLITAIIAGQLSQRAKSRAEEAEQGRHKIESLYRDLQEAFELASQAEAYKRGERLKSALLDAVTHDLRTPITSIKFSVTTLLGEDKSQQDTSNNEESLDTSLDAEGRHELLEVINEETDRLNRFVTSLVELARIEAGELHLRRFWSAVDEIVAMALERVAPLVREHEIIVEIENELPVARVDSSAIVEVIYNLIENAAKYSLNGTRIKIAVEHTPDQMLEFSVTDEGCGIPVDLREKVFDKFFRMTGEAKSDTTLATKISGIGMGLAIARGIIEAHGGNIWITDGEQKRGTRICFTVPIGDEEL